MNDQQRAFERVLSLVGEAGCARHVVLVGSWAEFAYRESGLLAGFDPNIRTLDVDFLVRNLRRPNPPASLTAVARERGFMVDTDRLEGTTKIIDVSGLEVEFLINKVGAGLEATLKTNVGVTAQTLRHMDILLRSTLELVCLGHKVTVPEPEAYALHKMAVNRDRKDKAEKDAQAVLGLWPHLDRKRFDELLASLTKKEAAEVAMFMDKQGLT